MTDIVSIFPTADDFNNESADKYSLYFFEQELLSIFRLIVWGKNNGFKKVQISNLSDMAKDFLIEKGFEILKINDDEWVKWGD